MLILILIFVIFGIIFLRKASSSGKTDKITCEIKPQEKSVQQSAIARREALAKITELCPCVKDNGSDAERLINVAGVEHYTNLVRGIYGIVVNDVANRYNSRAMLVLTAQKEKIGYIPERELEDYWEWTEGAKFPFVGFVNKKADGQIYSSIKVIRPTSQFAVLDAARKYVEWLTKEYDTSRRLSLVIPDVYDEELYRRLLEAEKTKPQAKVVQIAETNKKPRRDKWEAYLKEFEMMEITKATALKENRELEFIINQTYYDDEVKNASAGVFYGSIHELPEKPGIFAVYNKKKMIFELDETDSKEYAQFYGKPAPVVCEINKRFENFDGDVEIEWDIDGVAILPLSEEYVVSEIELTWGSYGGKEEKLPKW